MEKEIRLPSIFCPTCGKMITREDLYKAEIVDDTHISFYFYHADCGSKNLTPAEEKELGIIR